MQVIQKPWGKEEILTRQDSYMVKRLHMDKGKRCSLQYHANKIETIYVLSGKLSVSLNGEVIMMLPGNFCTIMPGEIHRMEGIEDTIYLESSTPELEDVVRVEDDYDRK